MFRHVLAAGVALFLTAAMAQSETWQLDPPHSAAHFAVRHMGISTVRGTFSKVGGTIQYDPADPAKTVLDVSIDAASIDSHNTMRDKDLLSDHFLDVQKYPSLTFKSKRVETSGNGKLKITGDLTIHGVTKEVSLDVDGPAGPVKDPHGNSHMGASATTNISRRDFGIDADAGVIGDNVAITLDVEMVRTPAATN